MTLTCCLFLDLLFVHRTRIEYVLHTFHNELGLSIQLPVYNEHGIGMSHSYYVTGITYDYTNDR
jgi:hypothetical protein